MMKNLVLLVAVLIGFLRGREAVAESRLQDTTSIRNVLYIVVDDLTSNLELFGGEIRQMVTPNLERLARWSINFHRAYAQQAVCGPSRNSFLTGLYPDQTHVYTFTTSFRDEHPEAVPLPEYFKRRGFLTCGFGKTYHDDRILSPPNYDEPRSWSDDCAHYAPPQDFCGPDKHGWCTLPSFGENDYTDGLGTTAAIHRLRSHHQQQQHNATTTSDSPRRRPFFFVVGLRKPHMDWALPQAFFDRQTPQTEIELPPPSRRVTPEGQPPIAWWNCSVEGPWKKSMAELRLYPKQPLEDAVEQEILRAYYAAVSYMDHQVGRLLDELESLGLRESTAIVFHSDHGFALSEEGMHCKRHTMEAGARVPLLVSVPWLVAEGEGRNDTSTIVELVDVYPTIRSIIITGDGGGDGHVDDESGTSAATQRGEGGPAAATLHHRSLAPRLYGRDLLPLLLGGGANTNNHSYWRRVGLTEADLVDLPALQQGVAFSQYPRCRSHPDAPGGLHHEGYHWNRECCLDSNDAIDAMGFSIRVRGFRYTEWFKFENTTWLPRWNTKGFIAAELYEMDDGGLRPSHEGGGFRDRPFRNAVQDKEYASTRRVLSRLLAQHFGSLLRPKPGSKGGGDVCLGDEEEGSTAGGNGAVVVTTTATTTAVFR